MLNLCFVSLLKEGSAVKAAHDRRRDGLAGDDSFTELGALNTSRIV